jgi:uncharacterized membrane-anchored protein YjiN (DUF445 family)
MKMKNKDLLEKIKEWLSDNPNGWDMNEIVAQIVLEYGQEFEQLARLIIMHMMHDKSYGKHKEKLYKELVKIYKGKEDSESIKKYLQYVEA